MGLGRLLLNEIGKQTSWNAVDVAAPLGDRLQGFKAVSRKVDTVELGLRDLLYFGNSRILRAPPF
jgi:hypothetical protein